MKTHRLRLLKISTLIGLSLLFAEAVHPPRSASAVQETQRAIDFNRDIRPILSDKCFACHGPDAPNKKIKLRLDSEEAAKADLGRGRRAVVPGDTERSQLVRRITATDEAMVMPPAHATQKLTKDEINLLVEWVKQGARWQQHWAFVTPARPSLPEVKNAAWVKNEIDRFVLARLEQAGLQPSPEASREILLRRVTLDLTGLPPTLKELDDFLSDQSPNAYEKVVDRLLASPRFGERMAFRWLDAARYADTNGYQIDGDRSAWRWRDWVIDAFNQNKPYDQFVIEQLAGDLLPNATLDQRIATGFNRNHRINAEGGIVSEEYRIEYVVDRVDTTATVFMGLTFGCARCHNHKYDPLTQREFYALSAYFNNIDEDGHSFDQGNSPPWIIAPTRAQQAKLHDFDNQIAQAKRDLAGLKNKANPQQRRWERALATGRAEQQTSDIRHQTSDFLPEKLIVRHALDEGAAPVFNKSDREHHEQYDRKKDEPPFAPVIGFKDGAPRFVPSPLGQGVAFDGKLYFDAGIHADFRYKSTTKDYRERFTIAAWVNAAEEHSGTIVAKVSDAPAEVENNLPRAVGYGLYFANGRINFNLIFRWGEDALRVETAEPVAINEWHHVAVLFDGLKQNEERVQIYVDGQPRKLRFIQKSSYLLFGNSKDTLKIGAGGGPQFRFKGALDEVRLYSRTLDAQELAALACADSLARIAAIPPARRTAAQADKIDRSFIALAAPPELKQAHATLFDLRAARQQFEDNVPTLMVMQEMAQARPTHLLKRGAYDAPGELVARATPAALPPLSAGLPNNRLGFARWLVSKEHPLTARVAVNRFWQMLFGAGLVRTVEDFGSQGELPSHPELLDWLAVQFRQGDKETRRQGDKRLSGKETPDSRLRTPDSGWDVKALLKTIVMSATYRQSSAVNPQSAIRNPQSTDPDNRLLARGPRYRLPAEMIRDGALAMSGLLTEKLGGPSVKPYQPEGLYKDMAFSGLTGYAPDAGEGLWRRSLYTFWKRTVLAPTMAVFDASAREFCTVREVRTNTPLQALNLMNDVTYVEAARLLAERAIKESGASAPEARLAWAFRAVTSRQAHKRERETLLRAFQKQLAYFTAHPKEADALLAVGARRNDTKLNQMELAAYAMTASLILNLDEVITKQ